MQVVSIIGSPNEISRSAKIIEYSNKILSKNSIVNHTYSIRDFPADDIFYANYNNENINQFFTDVSQSQGVVIATPIYKSSLSGVLKSLLDLLPQDAFKNKTILPFANAGSVAHLLALDYSLKPILSSMKASEIISGVIAQDKEIQYDNPNYFDDSLKKRIDESLRQFLQTLHRSQVCELPDFVI
ncbi:NADPH-dependent FMN reductase [Neisseriaceae bacterium PsAf]|nr:NADPH-dependent FMN reductase [Neisseriaceae bacterium PsAf]